MNSNDEDQVFEALLDYLRRSRGFDFTGYKRSSLKRRVCKRMQFQGVNNFDEYLDYLEVHPEEFIPLFNTILINVTAFFRDTAAWDYLQRQIIPQIISNKPQTEQIRFWSAGCASGEEAYTLAMLLTEALGVEGFRQRVKIYATDVDEEALSQARHASYSAKAIQPLPNELREKYFEPTGERYAFRPDLRRAVIFGRHDLVQDAPISRLDLLVCRNTLMYFNAETQARILARFHFALNNTGILFLGKAEMLLTHAHLFTPINLQHCIFARVPKVNRRNRLLALPQISNEEVNSFLNQQVRLQELALDNSSIAQIVVDFNGNLVLANLSARNLFNLDLQDIGKPLQDLEISYRPLELRSYIEQVYQDRQLTLIPDVARNRPNRNEQYLDVQITPLQDQSSALLGVSISFTDVTRYHELRSELQRSNQELETANEELQSSNQDLRKDHRDSGRLQL